MMLDYKSAPNNWGDVWQLYVEHGISPGSFGRALLENDLREAFGRADHINIHLIREHLQWMYDNLPSSCWGSEESVVKWERKGGLKGYET